MNPVGARISVIGSSFAVVRNTSAAPATSAGRRSGSVTVRNASIGRRPRTRADSSRLGEIDRSPSRIGASAWGRNRTAYASASSASVWYRNGTTLRGEEHDRERDDDPRQRVAW